MSVHVIITFQAKDERLAAFAQVLQQVKADLPNVAGCEAVRIFNDSTDERVFTLVETWESQSAHRAHVERVIASGGWDRIAAHLAADPVSSYYREV